MAWSDIPGVVKKVLNYFGEDKHEKRVLRKFIGSWDRIRPAIKVTDSKDKKRLKRMDKLRKELR
jgi:hypothetical protein